MTTQKWRFADKTDTLQPLRRNSAGGTSIGNWLSRFRLPQLSRSFAIKFLAACTLLTTLQIALEYQNIHHLLLSQVEHRAEAVAGNFRLLSDINQRFSLTQAKRLASWTVNTLDDVEQIYLVNPQFKIVASASRNELKPANSAQDILGEPEIRDALSRSFKDHAPHHIEIMRDGLLLHAHIVPLPRLGVSMIETINLVSIRQEIFKAVAGSTIRRIGVMLVLLMVIIGIADILMHSPLDERQREQVELIKESGENLLAIINNILDHSKLEAGRFELENDACSPREVTRFVIDLMQKAADEKGLKFESRITDDAPSFFLCDNKRLRQILINLVSNAIKFTPSGAVSLNVFLNSATDSTESNIVFAVRDTGVGIPDSLLPQLFNRYKQANASTARTHGGTGLGLAISKELATLMGGAIEVASVQGVGTTFSLVLPFKPVNERVIPTQTREIETVTVPENRAVEDTTPTTTKLRILLAEDQPVNQKLMRAVMEQLGHDLTIANNGVEAVKAPRTSTFDLILMDIQMPELDGILATKIIRSTDEEWSRIPIIALTAHAMENHKQAYFAAGMNGFVSKPFRMDTLVKEIDRVLREAQGNAPSNEAIATTDTCNSSELNDESSATPNAGAKKKALTDMLNELESMGI